MGSLITEGGKGELIPTPNGNDSVSKLEGIETDMIALIKECELLKLKLIRRDETSKKDTNNLLLKFSEILDIFDRTFQYIESKKKEDVTSTETWIKLFESMRKHSWKIVKEVGINVIEAVGKKAEPGLHTIVETKKLEAVEDDTIIEEITKGYFWLDEVLRKAEVITVKN